MSELNVERPKLRRPTAAAGSFSVTANGDTSGWERLKEQISEQPRQVVLVDEDGHGVCWRTDWGDEQ